MININPHKLHVTISVLFKAKKRKSDASFICRYITLITYTKPRSTRGDLEINPHILCDVVLSFIYIMKQNMESIYCGRAEGVECLSY